MHDAYRLYSHRDGQCDTGATSNLRARVCEHQEGGVLSTRGRRPLELACDEACVSQAHVFRRARYLKTGRWKRYLLQRLKVWPSSISSRKLERR